MHRTTRDRGPSARATTAVIVLATVVMTSFGSQIPMAGAQGVVSNEVTESLPITLDPTDFDPLTITDTEVSRMQATLVTEQMTARLVDRLAANRVSEAVGDVAEARTDLRRRSNELTVLENTLGAAAIESYIADSSADSVAFFGLGADSDSTFADETSIQLLERRAEARQAVADATAELEQATRLHQIAISRKRFAARSVEAAEARQEEFDVLASQYESAAERADAKAMAMSSEVELRSVAGVIIVNASIESDIDRLIADARADGLSVSGGGYRTIEQQVALRLSHCGGSMPAGLAAPGDDATPEERAAYELSVAEHRQYVIYEVPSGSCSPPTATPGNSEHQLGLAIDFTQDGSILDRRSDLFAWLDEHAEDYGLINLPSEAWHWSTTGQ